MLLFHIKTPSYLNEGWNTVHNHFKQNTFFPSTFHIIPSSYLNFFYTMQVTHLPFSYLIIHIKGKLKFHRCKRWNKYFHQATFLHKILNFFPFLTAIRAPLIPNYHLSLLPFWCILSKESHRVKVNENGRVEDVWRYLVRQCLSVQKYVRCGSIRKGSEWYNDEAKSLLREKMEVFGWYLQGKCKRKGGLQEKVA